MSNDTVWLVFVFAIPGGALAWLVLIWRRSEELARELVLADLAWALALVVPIAMAFWNALYSDWSALYSEGEPTLRFVVDLCTLTFFSMVFAALIGNVVSSVFRARKDSSTQAPPAE